MTTPDHTNHTERAHAYLSCSGSDRWLNCTVAPSREAKFADESSKFAQEGTDAHELGDYCLSNNIDTHEHPAAGSDKFPASMLDYVQQYVDYVRDVAKGGELMVEQRFDISMYVPKCFGTSDAVVIKGDHIHVIDLKYGKGLRVDAQDNSQGMLYALGAYEAYDCIYGPTNKITIHIVQPRLNHWSTDEHDIADLLAWGESIKPTAQLAFEGLGDAVPGDHCKFCKARHTCRERADLMIHTIGRQPKGEALTDAELAALYPRLSAVVSWANDLQEHCLKMAERGSKLNGLKLVEGISRRKLTDKEQATQKLKDAGYTDQQILNIELKGFTDLEKLMGKKKFSELLGDLVIKPQGKPTLVSVTDERPEISNHDLAVEELLTSNV